MRGPGETEIETDRRIVRDRISLLKDKIKVIDKQMSVQRSNRGAMVRVALVGYTNVGKSTLMNVISKSEVFVENKLFATLDTTVRKVVIKNLPFLLSDTVGFIRKLPTQLVAVVALMPCEKIASPRQLLAVTALMPMFAHSVAVHSVTESATIPSAPQVRAVQLRTTVEAEVPDLLRLIPQDPTWLTLIPSTRILLNCCVL